MPVRTQEQGFALRSTSALRVATCEADDDGDLNAVVTIGPAALLLLWRGYADQARRTRPAPRFHAARRLLAETLSPLPLATSRAGDGGRGDRAVPMHLMSGGAVQQRALRRSSRADKPAPLRVARRSLRSPLPTMPCDRVGDIWITQIGADRRWPHDCIRAGGPSEAPSSALAQCHGCGSGRDGG